MEALKTGLIYYENAAISGSVAIFMVRGERHFRLMAVCSETG